MEYVDQAVRLSFPEPVRTVEDRILFTLWQEGAQCVANLCVLMGVKSIEVRTPLKRLAKAGKVQIATDDLENPGPFAMCSLAHAAATNVSSPSEQVTSSEWSQ